MQRIKTRHIPLIQRKGRNSIKKIYKKNMNYIKQNKLDTIYENEDVVINENIHITIIDECRVSAIKNLCKIINDISLYNLNYEIYNKVKKRNKVKTNNKNVNFKKPKYHKKDNYKFKNMKKHPINRKIR
jgi:hypothetical protein